MRRPYWVPNFRWQLEEWLRDWAKRTGKPLPGLRKRNKRELYALYFSIMDAYVRRGRTGRLRALHGEALTLVAHDGKKADAICFSLEPENREPK